MAMVGLGCRAPKSMFVQHAAFMRLLPYCTAARDTSSWSGTSSSYFALSPWRAGSRDNTFWQHLRLGLERRGSVELRSSPNRYYVKAADISGPETIDSPLMQSMQKKIKDDLQAESVSVKDAYGDGRHVSIDVVASAFEGKSAVNRQRLVYKAIWEELQATVHAVDQLKTRTPSEAAKSPDQL